MHKMESYIYLGFNPNASTIEGLNQTLIFFNKININSLKDPSNVFDSTKIETEISTKINYLKNHIPPLFNLQYV
jgi:hypothetical protein